MDYGIWRPGAPDGVGDVYRGRVIARVPAMAGAFVALGGAEGFLPDSDGGAGLTDGDGVTVRVTRAAQGGKGPRLAAHDGATDLGRGRLPCWRAALACCWNSRRASRTPLVELDDAHWPGGCDLCWGNVCVLRRGLRRDDEDAVEALAAPDVDLPGAARLHIQPTPALVAIDVDAGTAMGGGRARRRRIWR